MTYSRRIVDAFAFTFDLHKDQIRKGTGVPYITHLMAVAAIVGEYGGDEDQIIAALLHDAVEDQGGRATLARIREEFGDRVAQFVEGCSDADTIPKPPWLERKSRFLESIRDAPGDLKLIVAADKLHNARAIVNSLHEVGNKVWERFTKGRDASLWYSVEAVRALANAWSHPILRELRGAARELQRLARKLEADGQDDSSGG